MILQVLLGQQEVILGSVHFEPNKAVWLFVWPDQPVGKMIHSTSNSSLPSTSLCGGASWEGPISGGLG